LGAVSPQHVVDAGLELVAVIVYVVVAKAAEAFFSPREDALVIMQLGEYQFSTGHVAALCVFAHRFKPNPQRRQKGCRKVTVMAWP
jgi:hypothetical protein